MKTLKINYILKLISLVLIFTYQIKTHSQAFYGENIKELKDKNGINVFCIKALNSGKTIGISLNSIKQYLYEEKFDCPLEMQFQLIPYDFSKSQYFIFNMKTHGTITENIRGQGLINDVTVNKYTGLENQIWIIEFTKKINKKQKNCVIKNFKTGHVLTLKKIRSSTKKIIGISRLNINYFNQQFVLNLIDNIEHRRNPKYKFGQVISHTNEIIKNGYYCIRAVLAGKAIGISYHHTGDQIYQYGLGCPLNMLYRLIQTRQNDTFYLQSLMNGKVMTIENNNTKHVLPVTLKNKSKNNKYQMWKLKYSNLKKLKEWQIFNVGNHYTMDIERGLAKNHQRLISYKFNHRGPNQRFVISLIYVDDFPRTL